MPSDDPVFLSMRIGAPVQCLPDRWMRVAFPLPAPLLRPLQANEPAASGLWSEWLAAWGWTWAVEPAACKARTKDIALWGRNAMPPADFDPRVLALATRLRLRLDDRVLIPGDARPPLARLDAVWKQLRQTSRDDLAEALAAVLFHSDASLQARVFAMNAAAPHWHSDSQAVLFERSPLVRPRSPTPLWLRAGYELLARVDEMRGVAVSMRDWEEFGPDVDGAHGLPSVFALHYWWEATYCLSERQDFDAAATAAARVDALAARIARVTDLVEPLWHLQRARLHYYDGRLGEALANLTRELAPNRWAGPSGPMLLREAANVLSDLGCLEAAARLATQAVEAATALSLDEDRYKSLGRRGEIAIKSGRLTDAQADFQGSLAIQDALGRDNSRAPGQTLCFLGHVALLAGRHDEARLCYDRADACDTSGNSRAYTTMARFALARACGESDTLARLWAQHRPYDLPAWRTSKTLALPATVCCAAAAGAVPEAQYCLPEYIHALVDANYAIEAIYLLPSIPHEQAAPLLERVLKLLAQWHKSLNGIDRRLLADAGPLDGPARIVKALQPCKETGDWGAYPYFSLCYPLTLLGSQPASS